MFEMEVTEAIELTELFGPCVYLEFTEDTDGLEPCVGVPGVDAAEAEAPNSRRVDENRRDGRRRDDENYGMVSVFS